MSLKCYKRKRLRLWSLNQSQAVGCRRQSLQNRVSIIHVHGWYSFVCLDKRLFFMMGDIVHDPKADIGSACSRLLEWVERYSSSLRHPLRYSQWLLRHEMSSLHEIDCLLCWSAQDKLFIKALLMNDCLKNELRTFVSHHKYRVGNLVVRKKQNWSENVVIRPKNLLTVIVLHSVLMETDVELANAHLLNCNILKTVNTH